MSVVGTEGPNVVEHQKRFTMFLSMNPHWLQASSKENINKSIIISDWAIMIPAPLILTYKSPGKQCTLIWATHIRPAAGRWSTTGRGRGGGGAHGRTSVWFLIRPDRESRWIGIVNNKWNESQEGLFWYLFNKKKPPGRGSIQLHCCREGDYKEL